jgi:hypothetical protein
MNEIIILNKETYSFLMNTLRQVHNWLQTDAVYAHPNANIKKVETNIQNSLRMINNDITQYKDNCKILVDELNKQAHE